MALPKPPPSVDASMAAMMQRRRRSGLRTAAASVQEQFLERVRAVAEDPTLVLPEGVGEEPALLARLRRALEKAQGGGSLPFTARFDKGLLGAVRVARQVARLQATPRLLDARVDGNRRFFLPRGHVVKLVSLGVQNWDDPLALLLAYGPLAKRHRLNFFAGSGLWCTGASTAPPEPWWTDLAERTGLQLARGEDGAACPHDGRVRLELRFPGGPALLACAPCAGKAGHLHGHLLQRCLVGASPSRPVQLQAVTPDGRRLDIREVSQQRYRAGLLDEARLLEEAQARRGAAPEDGGPRFELAGRAFPDQEAFLAGLGLADWELPAARVLTAGGHAGASAALSDVLAAHRGRLGPALDTLLPGQGAAFAARHAGVEVRSLLKLAREEAARQAATRDLPDLAGLGPVGAWLDGLVRDSRRLDRVQLLQRLRKEAAAAEHPAHFFAALVALNLAHEGERFLPHDAKEAGRHLAPLVKKVLEAKGEEYRAALGDYLRESGTGEALAP